MDSRLLQQYDAFVFDFDCTITRRHTRGMQPLSQLSDQEVMGNVYTSFPHVVRQLLQHGKRVAIASFAHMPRTPKADHLAGTDLILRYMDVVFGRDRDFLHADSIEAWIPRGAYSYNKNGHLTNLRQRSLAGIPKHRILLIDDDPDDSNLPAARLEGYGTAKALKGVAILKV